MPEKKNSTSEKIAAIRRKQEEGYRERALKLFPWICARCGREFTGKRLRELTVHHKDHNHENNPTDGGNWELLCLYCHDNEHARYDEQKWHGHDASNGRTESSGSINMPFAALADLLNKKKEGPA